MPEQPGPYWCAACQTMHREQDMYQEEEERLCLLTGQSVSIPVDPFEQLEPEEIAGYQEEITRAYERAWFGRKDEPEEPVS